MNESDKIFLETFRKDPELAIKIIQIILDERQRKEQGTVPSPAA